MWEIGCAIMMTVLLVITAYIDVKTHTISVMLLAQMTVVACLKVAFLIYSEEAVILNIWGGLVGGFFLVASKLTQEKIGYGDSILLTIIALYLGIWEFLQVGVLTFLTCYIYLLICFITKKLQKRNRIPLAPFVLLGYLGGVLGGVLV